MRTSWNDSLQRRFALTAASLAVSVLLLTALASMWLVSQQHNQAERVLLQKEADFNATLISSTLGAIMTRMREASESSLLANALVDSAGRQTYLIPYLNGLQRINGVEVQLLFVDFEGKEIASSEQGHFSLAQLAWLKTQLASGKKQTMITQGAKGDELLVVDLLTYNRTQTPEGALMYRVLLPHLVSGAGAQLIWDGAATATAPGKNGLEVNLKVPEAMQAHHLRVRQTEHLDSHRSLNSEMWPAWIMIILFALILAVVVLWLGLRLASALTMDLRELEVFSRSVVDNGFGQQRAILRGSVEVVGLARSFNHMLDRLNQQHTQLQHDSEERYRFLVEGTNAISWEASLPEADFFFVSPQAQQILGFAMADFLSPGFALSHIHTDDLAQLLERRQQAIAARQNYRCEYRFLCADGHYLWLEEIASVLFDGDGKAKNLRGILLDIDERKQADTRIALEHQKVDLLKNEFVSTVSHELRTPLTSIRGSLGLILGGVAGELPPSLHKLLDIAHKNSERLVRLISDLLDIDKIASGKMDFDFQWHDLLPLIEHALQANMAYAANLNVRLVLKRGELGVKVRVDYDRLMQVMTNLLSNAAKYSPQNSDVEVIMQVHGEWVRISVVDHGPGISPEFRKKIFQKFSQEDSSDTRQKGGTGLGLSITRALVEKMGGEIDFESEFGSGSTFYIDLPR
jgi:PAS domain S-box-containing protein